MNACNNLVYMTVVMKVKLEKILHISMIIWDVEGFKVNKDTHDSVLMGWIDW